MKKNTLAGILLAVMGLSVSAQAASVVVQNASFENPTLAPGGYTDNNFVNGFTFVFAGVEYPNPSANQFNFSGGLLPSTADGSQYAFMNGVGDGLASYMYQDVGTLLANTTYTFTVALGWRNDQGVGSIALGFVNGSAYTFGDAFLAESSAFLATTQGGFNDVTFTYTTGAVVSGDLTIVIRNPTLGAPTAIDNVRLDAVAVPEPSSIALLGVGAAALFVLRRKRGLRG